MTVTLTPTPLTHTTLHATPDPDGWQVTCSRCGQRGHLATQQGAEHAMRLHQCKEET